jgi:hypothetical protein
MNSGGTYRLCPTMCLQKCTIGLYQSVFYPLNHERHCPVMLKRQLLSIPEPCMGNSDGHMIALNCSGKNQTGTDSLFLFLYILT